jgi:hypothetical protein
MIASTSAQVLSEETEAISRTEAFSRAYARWLKALAQLEVPDSEDDEFMKGTFTEERAALRELFLAPAACSEIVWAKLAAFETDLVKERIVGEARDSVLLLGLGDSKTADCFRSAYFDMEPNIRDLRHMASIAWALFQDAVTAPNGGTGWHTVQMTDDEFECLEFAVAQTMGMAKDWIRLT